MQEKADLLLDAELPQLQREGQEMIILDPEMHIRRAKSHQRARHIGVDLAVATISLGVGPNQIGARVQGRPQHGVGEAFVKTMVMGFRQIDGCEGAIAESFDLGK